MPNNNDLMVFNKEGQPVYSNQLSTEEPNIDTQLLLNFNPMSDQYAQDLEQQITIIKSGLTGENPAQVYQNTKASLDKEAELSSAILQKQQNDLVGVEEWVKQSFNSNNTDLSLAVDDAKLLLKEYKEEHQGPLAPEQAVTDQLSSVKESFDYRKLRDQAIQSQLALRNELGKALEKSSGLDKLKDLAVYFLPFTFNKDANDFTGANLLNTPESVQKVVLQLQSLSPERRKALAPALTKIIIDSSDGNTAGAAALASALLEPGQGASSKTDARVNQIFDALSVLGVGAIGKTITNLYRAVRTASNTVKMAEELGNKTLASQINAITIADPSGEAAKAAGLTVEKVMQNAEPIVLPFDKSATVGLGKDTQQSLLNFSKKLEEAYKLLTTEGETVKPKAFAPEEVELLAQKELKSFETKILDEFNGEAAINKAEIQPLGDNQAILKLEVGVGNKEVKYFNKDFVLTENDINGMFDLRDVAPLNKAQELVLPFLSTTARVGLNNLDIYGQANRAYLAEIKARQVIGNVAKEAFTGLNTKSLNKIDRIMEAGVKYIDETGTRVGREYTPGELRGGIDTAEGTISLTNKEIEAYYKQRSLYDFSFQMENDLARREYQLKGFKSATINDVALKAKPYDLSLAKAEATKGEVKRVLNTTTNTMVDIERSNEVIEQAYQSGQRLVKLSEPIDLSATKGLLQNERVVYALVPDQVIKDLPNQVLAKVKGYIPSLYRRNEFFVHKFSKYAVNGSEGVDKVAVRRFASKKRAEQFAEELNKKEWDGTGTPPYRVLADRELTVEQSIGDQAVSGNRPIFGHRADKEIAYGKEARDPELLPASEILARNLEHVARYFGNNEVRVSRQQQWVNTAKEAGFNVKSFFDDVPSTTLEGKKLNVLKQVINKWNGIPTRDERVFAGTVQWIHDWALEGLNHIPGFKNTEDLGFLINTKYVDPGQVIRSANYHILLGMMNFSAGVVQLSQAAVALAVNPTNFGKASRLSILMRAMDIPEKAVGKKIILDRLLASPLYKDLNKDAVSQMYKLWDKSGYKFAGMHNSIYESMTKGIGISSNTMNKILKGGEFFYQEGVGASNRYAFVNAFLEWQKANPGKALTEAGEKWILARTDRDLFHMLNMDRGHIYEGVFSIPLQFSQILIKTGEALIGREYTAYEKLKMMSGQLTLFGMSGMPLGDRLVDGMYRQYGVEPSLLEGKDRAKYKALTGGMLEAIPYIFFNADLDISKRAGLLNGLGIWAIDTITDDRPLWMQFTGPFKTTLPRFLDAGKALADFSLNAISKLSIDKVDLYIAAEELLKLPSSTRNVLMAIDMARTGKVFNAKGQVIADDFTTAEILATATGFKPSKIREGYTLTKYNYLSDDEIKAVADEVMYQWSQMAKYYDDPSDPSLIARAKSTIAKRMQQLSVPEQQRLLNKLKYRISHPVNKYDSAVEKFIKQQIPSKMVKGLEEDGESLKKKGFIDERSLKEHFGNILDK